MSAGTAPRRANRLILIKTRKWGIEDGAQDGWDRWDPRGGPAQVAATPGSTRKGSARYLGRTAAKWERWEDNGDVLCGIVSSDTSTPYIARHTVWNYASSFFTWDH